MSIDNENTTLSNLLLEKGFTDGWVLSNDKLILWEHDENPPAPLKRPKANETLSN